MTNDPLDAMKARWNHIQGSLFPWLREEVDPITEALGRLVTALDVTGLEAFVPEPPRGPGRPPEDRRALARAFVAKAMLGVPTTNALVARLVWILARLGGTGGFPEQGQPSKTSGGFQKFLRQSCFEFRLAAISRSRHRA